MNIIKPNERKRNKSISLKISSIFFFKRFGIFACTPFDT